MHKLDGNRTLAHSGGNALDRTVTHVAGYLLAGRAHLIVRTDVAGPCAHHSNQVTAVFLSWVGRRALLSSVFRVRAHCSQRMLPCLSLFAVHTGAWPVARFGEKPLETSWFVASQKTPPRCTRAASVPDKSESSKIFSKFSPTPRLIYHQGEAPPGKPRALSKLSQK